MFNVVLTLRVRTIAAAKAATGVYARDILSAEREDYSFQAAACGRRYFRVRRPAIISKLSVAANVLYIGKVRLTEGTLALKWLWLDM